MLRLCVCVCVCVLVFMHQFISCVACSSFRAHQVSHRDAPGSAWGRDADAAVFKDMLGTVNRLSK